jgi:hypothetical protein
LIAEYGIRVKGGGKAAQASHLGTQKKSGLEQTQ